MFRGSIPTEAQSICWSIIKDWPTKDIYVGCSGNFTIEKFLAGMGEFALHSNDVTLYSRCIADFLLGNHVGLELAEAYAQELAWMKEYMQADGDRLATLMLATRICTYIGKTNEYYRSMLGQYIKQWPQMHKKTMEKLEANRFQIKAYFSGDFARLAESPIPGAGLIAYPPFGNAGKAFAKDFAKLESIFVYDPPDYAFFSEESLKDIFRKMMAWDNWCFGTNLHLREPEFTQHLRGMTKTTNRGVPIFIYANVRHTRIVMPKQETELVGCVKLKAGHEIGNVMKLKVLSNAAFQGLRSQYMNINIRPGSATLAVAVLVDDILIGVYAFSAGPTLAQWDKHIDTPTLYLLSDFPVEPTDYDRLAKLVLIAALSKESKLLAERVTKKRVRSLVTTAYSKNPASMKYRGLFKLLTRKENKAFSEEWAKEIDPTNAYYNQPYELNYGAEIGHWTLQEGLAMWKQKHAQRGGKKERD